MSERELAAAIGAFFAETCTHAVVAAAERDGADPKLWQRVAELGFPLVGIDEARGGSGGSLSDLIEVLAASGRFAVPLPLAETSLAAWLLSSAGAEVDTDPMTVMPDSTGLRMVDGRMSGTALRVPWARAARRVVGVLATEAGRSQVVAFDPFDAQLRPGTDLAGMPRDDLTLASVPASVHGWDGALDDVLLRGALVRAAQLAGAIDGAFELTRRYVRERVQFGRAIGTFQSVQAHVVELAQAATMTTLAVHRAGRAATTGRAWFEIVAAKSVANGNAARAAAAAHQAHGAIGMTQEYGLQHLSRRMHAWRAEFGDEVSLNERLGAAVARANGIFVTATRSASRRHR